MPVGLLSVKITPSVRKCMAVPFLTLVDTLCTVGRNVLPVVSLRNAI
jgi:hypothetical protein